MRTAPARNDNTLSEKPTMKQKRVPRIRMLRDGQKRPLKLRIRRKLLGPGKEPRIHFRVDRSQFRLQARRVAFRIVHQEPWVDPEEPRKQFSRRVRQVRARPIFNLRDVRLAQAAPNFLLHGGCQLLLGHRAAQAAQRTFHRTKRSKFVAEFHGGSLLYIAICKYYIAICYLSSEIAALPVVP